MMRKILFASAAVLGLAAYASTAFGLYARERVWDVESVLSRSAGANLAPKPKRYVSRAQAVLRDALELLQQRDRQAGERLREYRERLERAERMLVHALRRDPTRAEAWALLAAVRSERTPPRNESESLEILALVERASAMAPRRPPVLRRHGELLLRMGRESEAVETLARAATLDPALSADIIRGLALQWVPADAVVAAFPEDPVTTAALWPVFERESRAADYHALIVSRGRCDDRSLLAKLGQASVLASLARETEAFLGGCPTPPDPGAAAERWWQLADAARRDGRTEAAVERGSRAVDSESNHYRYPFLQGNLLASLDRAEQAIPLYREALRRVGRGTARDRSRAAIYRRLARSLERVGRGDHAYDAWKRSALLDPTDKIAPARLREMEASAGILSR